MKQPTILIVDDEPDLREAMAFDFRRNKFNVLTAASGNEAFRIIESNKVDLVLSDVCMPDGGGVQLLERIKERDLYVPSVMLVTGFADITIADAYAKGADAVFSKPFDRKQLMNAVQKALQPDVQRIKRRSSRIEVDIPVELKVDGNEQPLLGKIGNLGRDGIFAEMTDNLPAVSDTVEFQFQTVLTGLTMRLSGRGVVRWVCKESNSGQPTGCGIEFTELSPDCVKNIIGLINFSKTNSSLPIK